jgi:aspartate racemase
MTSALFGMVKNVEIVLAQADEIEQVHDIYCELVRTGQGSKAKQETLTKIAFRLIERDALDAIIFAGTDFTSIFDPTNADFPSLDCAALHVQAIASLL